MKRFWMACFLAGAFMTGSAPAIAFNGPIFLDAHLFVTLPDGVRHPEGIATNPDTGEVFVGTFDFGPNPNKVLRYSRDRQLLATRDFGSTPLLGLDFEGGNVYILNFGAGTLQRMPGNFDSGTAVETVAVMPKIGPPAPRTVTNPDTSSDVITFGSNSVAAPNGMVLDHAGDAYISDSFQGAIFKVANATTCTTPCAVTTVSHDPLLATAGFPPFGANGLALSADEQTLFIANTGDNRVLKMDVASGAVSVFAESVHGADGLLFENGRLWVAANQADEVVALDAAGRPIIRVGFFAGIRRDGRPVGLLFPASMAIADGFMYITNLALALTPAVGDEPEEDVKLWTISRVRVPRH